jgi:glycosyltransferase involved in cell wall biosynthesis
MDSSPGLTVFILSYNRPDFIKEAVKSLLEQTSQPEGIVILDNCSSDENLREVMKLSGKKISVVTTSINHPSLWNYERAIDLASSTYKTKYIYIMHDDDRILPSFLEQMTELLEKNPSYSAATCKGYLIDPSGKRTGCFFRSKPATDLVFHSQSEVALYYSKGQGIAFPFVVIRNGTIQRVNRSAGLGIADDQVCMCRLADIGPIIKSHLRLFEYRIHESQESMSIDHSLRKKRNQFFLEIADGDETKNEIQRNIYGRETSIFLAQSIKQILNSEFEFGMRLLINDYKEKNMRIRYLLDACILLSRRLLDAKAGEPN